MIFSEFLGALLVSLVTAGFGLVWIGVEVRNLRRWYQLRSEGHDMRDQIFGSSLMLLVCLGCIAGVVLHYIR